MNAEFERRVRAAAGAGWWVALIVLGVILLQWLAYLTVIRAQPAWLLSLWGPGTDWAFIQRVWFWAIAVLKFVWWLIVLGCLWLTLWARQLRKHVA